MNAIQSASALTSALVHPSAQRSSTEAGEHRSFITAKLVFSAVALASAPFFLVYHGAPTPAEATIFAFILLQIAAAMVVTRTGRLVAGHILAACGFGAVALALAFGVRAGFAASLVWVALAEFEAVSSLNGRVNRLATVTVPLVILVRGRRSRRSRVGRMRGSTWSLLARTHWPRAFRTRARG